MYFLRFQGSCYPLNDDSYLAVQKNQEDQRRLSSLGRVPEALRVLRLALTSKDVNELEDSQFGKVPSTASDEERCLLRTIRHTLQDFVSKCG